MRFVDQAEIKVWAGKGGRCAVAFRREKYEPKGGPAGGDGGRGGDVVVMADARLQTLMDYSYRRELRAQNGAPGGPNCRSGAAGEDLVVQVPPGTLVRDADEQQVIADLSRADQSVVVAEGGAGGRGNARFATSRNRAPRHAQPGQPGAHRRLALELKVVADVGLVGAPNAGKSTLLARLSASHPRIADYPFTTLTPNLGIVRIEDWRSFVLADIPGLIEDAHRGKGLGLEFLRHVERCRVLVLVVDGGAPDPPAQLAALRKELSAYGRGLAHKRRLIAVNKCDLGQPPRQAMSALAAEGEPVLPTSGLTGEGLRALGFALMELVEECRAAPEGDEEGAAPWRP